MIIAEIIFITALIIGISAIIILIKEKRKQKLNDYNIEKDFQEKKELYSKKPLLTQSEIKYKKALEEIINEINIETNKEYEICEQINLASIINKNDFYASELFRNIDFGICDKDYNIVLLIEINDSSHHEKHRIARDYKVKRILTYVGYELITLWTEYGISKDYIKKRLKEYL